VPIHSFIDLQAYKDSNQSLRLLGSTKIDYPHAYPKQIVGFIDPTAYPNLPFGPWEFYYDIAEEFNRDMIKLRMSLISEVTGCEMLPSLISGNDGSVSTSKSLCAIVDQEQDQEGCSSSSSSFSPLVPTVQVQSVPQPVLSLRDVANNIDKKDAVGSGTEENGGLTQSRNLTKEEYGVTYSYIINACLKTINMFPWSNGIFNIRSVRTFGSAKQKKISISLGKKDLSKGFHCQICKEVHVRDNAYIIVSTSVKHRKACFFCWHRRDQGFNFTYYQNGQCDADDEDEDN